MSTFNENGASLYNAIADCYDEVRSNSDDALRCLKRYQESRTRMDDRLQLLLHSLSSQNERNRRTATLSLLGEATNLKAASSRLDALVRRLVRMVEAEDRRLGRQPLDLSNSMDLDPIPDDRSDTEISDNMPPLLSEYFDLLGDLKLARETLDFELPMEHHEGRTERARLRDQEGVLSVTSTEFDARLCSQTEELTQKIHDLDQRAHRLKDACIRHGYDTDPARYVTRSESQASSQKGPSRGVTTWLARIPNAEEAFADPNQRSRSTSIASAIE